jgi:hypothetical protein
MREIAIAMVIGIAEKEESKKESSLIQLSKKENCLHFRLGRFYISILIDSF